jgi:cell division protein FtsB
MSPLIIPILGISCGLLAIIGGVFVKPWFAYRQRKLEIDAQMLAEKTAQYAANNGALEQRIQVLERIITDNNSSLSNAIEDLRDKPLN